MSVEATTPNELSEIQALRTRVAELETTVASLRPAPSHPTRWRRRGAMRSEAPIAHLSRRSLIRTLAGAGTGAALGAVAVAATGTPAGAADGDNVRAGLDTTATNRTRVIKGTASGINQGGALVGDAQSDNGVVGTSSNNDGVYGAAGLQSTLPFVQAGVYGDSRSAVGTAGASLNNVGVLGRTTGGNAGVRGEKGDATGLVVGPAGVVGDSAGFVAVLGRSISNAGVVGSSNTSVGVSGTSGSNTGTGGRSVNATGVHGISGAGIGVRGESNSNTGVSGQTTNGVFGVDGRSDGASGIGVNGFGGANVGVQGYGAKTGMFGISFTGLGGQFAGARAALRLVPRNTTGAPNSGSHERGELVIDSAGALFVCTANGTPGTWRRIAYT